MRVIKSADFIGEKAWDALDVEQIDGATVRLHWTDKPYKWHVNDGPEVFVVLSGIVNMHTRDQSGEKIWRLSAGDIFHAEAGDEHVAYPEGEARILVVERAGSV